jgi:sugar lactone lactonase YvrE
MTVGVEKRTDGAIGSSGHPVIGSSGHRPRRLVGGLALLALALLALAMAGLDVRLFRGGEPELPAVRLTNATIVASFPPLVGPGQQPFLAIEPGGELAVSDRVRQLVLRLGPDGRQLSSWGPRLGADAQIGEIGGIAVAGDHWYVLDRSAPEVLDLDAAGHVRNRVSLVQLQPYGPNGLAVDPVGNLYIADTGRSRILVFAPGGRFVKTFGTDGHELGQLKQPMALAVGPDGAIFVADWENARIERWQPAADGWQATAAWSTGFRPWGVAVDRAGRVYVPDTERRRVLVYTPDGTSLAEVGAGSAPIDVSNPAQVAVSADGTRLYVLGDDAIARLTLETAAAPPAAPRLPLLPIGLGVVLLAAGLVLVVVRRAGARGVSPMGAGAAVRDT